MLKHRFYKPILIVAAVCLLFGVSRTQQALNHDRERLGFTKLAPLENAPPVLAFTTVALGGFRGLISNFLWMRASDLQEQEKYFEFVQLSDWITKLEPHYTQVWSHQAWNMAWNISVKFKEPQERWIWVMRGITLLRDQGLHYNPDDALMYNSLSWIFQMKLGQNMDDAQQYYKEAWAGEMNELFGGKANIPELLEPKTTNAIARAKLLREKYKMDPQVMKEVDEMYGPLEWRLPDAHTIYWAEMGRRRSKPKDQETLRRNIYQSMQQALFGGGLTDGKPSSNGSPSFIVGPNLELMDKVNATYVKMKAEDPAMSDHVGIGHKNFLKEAIYLLYVDGRTKQAQQWFDYVRKEYPKSIPTNYTLVDYALPELNEKVGEMDRPKVVACILGLLDSAYMNLVGDDDAKAERLMEMADYLWKSYSKRLPKVSEERLKLDPFSEYKRLTLERMLDPVYGIRPEYAAILRGKVNFTYSTNSPAIQTNAVAPPPSKP